MLIDLLQALKTPVKDRHLGSEANGHRCCGESGNSSTENNHLGPLRAGHPGDQDPSTATTLHEMCCTLHGGHAASDFAHRGEQRQLTGGQAHGFIGNCGVASLEQCFGAALRGCQVQVGEQDLAGVKPEQFVLTSNGFFHFAHEVGFSPDLPSGIDESRANGFIGSI